MHEEVLKYVETFFKEDRNPSRLSIKYPFRDRMEHLKRVYIWCERILKEETDVNRDVVLIAALFHDVAKGLEGERGHEEIGAEISYEFLIEKGYSKEFAEQVSFCVYNHNEKVKAKNMCKEIQVLIDGDIMDEKGCMAVLWDSMAVMMNENPSYEKVLNRLNKTKKMMHKRGNPCITNTGRRIYIERLKIFEDFIETLEYELKKKEI